MTGRSNSANNEATKTLFAARGRVRRRLLLVIAVIAIGTTMVLSSATQFSVVNIPSSGTIRILSESTVILRGSLPNPYQDMAAYVRNYVGDYTFCPHMIEMCYDMGYVGILQYPEEFNSTYGTWSGFTWTQLQTLINAFHSYGWQVQLGMTGIAWNGQWMYNYIHTKHPELAFTDANGYRANDINGGNPNGNVAGNKIVGYDDLIPDFWANFSSADPSLGIANNSRLIDVIIAKLGQMIAGGLDWDGVALADGWNGFDIQGYTFGNTYPNWAASGQYSYSYQEENQWANDSTSGYGLPAIGQPSSWNSWNITQRASWILGNTTAKNQWYEWWCNRFSKMMLEFKDAIENNNPNPQGIYTSMGADASSQWNSGNLGGDGLLNFTMVANDDSIDVFLPAYENAPYSQMPAGQAYAASLVKTKDVRLQVAIGIIPDNWYYGNVPIPLGNMKQQYLSQAQSYTWYNGARYSTANNSVIFLDGAPDGSNSNVNQTAIQLLFNWINTVSPLFQNAQPVYLGPTIVNSYGTTSQDQFLGINYSIAQWTDDFNLVKSSSYINATMGTLWLEVNNFGNTYVPAGQLPTSYQDVIDQMFANKSLNLIISDVSQQLSLYGWGHQIFISGSESKVTSTFDMNLSAGATNQTAYILNQSHINNAIGKWIDSGYDSSTTWNNPASNIAYAYQNVSAFVPLAESADSRIALGTYYNSSSANFMFMQLYDNLSSGTPPYGVTIPREIVNKAIYWATNAPINSSESLVDYAVFRESDGSIAIPMMNEGSMNAPISSTLNINATALGLGSPSQYTVYWASDPAAPVYLSNWNSVPITLNGMADALVIAPK